MRRTVTTPVVRWGVDDENGDNPSGKPGVMEFDVTIEITPETSAVMYDRNMEGSPGSPASADVVAANCTSLWFDDEDKRKPTKEERLAFNDWFFLWLARRPSENRALQRLAFELTADAF